MTKVLGAPLGAGQTVRKLGGLLCGVLLLMGVLTASASAQLPDPNDPRVGLAPGLDNPGVANEGMDLLAHLNKPDAFIDPTNPGNFGFLNSDLAFQGDNAFVGNFNGFNIYDISNPAAPTLTTSVVCPGGQGDLSVYKNLLFMSVEETRAKKDCTSTPAADATTRFRGVRIFDISNVETPVQVGQVQTCRGSHTHTLVTDKHSKKYVYIYVQGTAGVRAPEELAGCDANNSNEPIGDNPSKWRIEVIKVPLRAPEDAAIVNDAAAVPGSRHGRRQRAAERPYRRRPIRRGWHGAPHPSRTPVTTSPCIRSSRSRRAPARATAC